jgi:AAA domain, putative AbiEii toxin, Type IV TA system
MTKKDARRRQRHAAVLAAAGQEPGIIEITVAGFKSITDERSIEIRPLTILAGANSSGKSSMMQPLLLLKQTLEAPYDAGPLMLNGPILKFTSAEHLLAKTGQGRSWDSFDVGMRLNNEEHFQTRFRKASRFGFRIEQMEISGAAGKFILSPEMTHAEIVKAGITRGNDSSAQALDGYADGQWKIKQERCFLDPTWVEEGTGTSNFAAPLHLAGIWERTIPEVIHLPGMRSNPERTYPVTAVGPAYSGTFEKYTASVIHHWSTENKEATLAELNASVKLLTLAEEVTAVRLNDVEIELRVGRLPGIQPKRPDDWVNIADVGRGVSEALPIVTALLAARPGQLVYLEQPEIHLHPNAQYAMARVLGNAANRGVQVVAETHSSLLLLGVQSLVAEGKLSPDKVKLHWFSRNKDGSSTITSGDLDDAGAFGDWPEDFDKVELNAESRYLDAAGARRMQLQKRT